MEQYRGQIRLSGNTVSARSNLLGFPGVFPDVPGTRRMWSFGMALTTDSRSATVLPVTSLPLTSGARTNTPARVSHPVPGQQVSIEGLVDARCVNEIRSALREAVDNGVGELVVDVGGLELGDATGLGALLGAHRRASRSGRKLVLESVNPTLFRVLIYTRLIRVFATRAAAASSAAV